MFIRIFCTRELRIRMEVRRGEVAWEMIIAPPVARPAMLSTARWTEGLRKQTELVHARRDVWCLADASTNTDAVPTLGEARG